MYKAVWFTRAVGVVLAVIVPFAMLPVTAVATDRGVLQRAVAQTTVPGVMSAVGTRTVGADRYTTSVRLSQEGWATSEYVVIATGEQWSDAIAGTSLAGVLDAPMLLSRRGGLPASVAAEIRRLGASKAIVLGGSGVLSDKVVDGIVAAGVARTAIERIGGKDKYERAARIAKRVHKISDGSGWAAVVSGEDFPDALALSAWAGALGVPVLYAKKGSIPSASSKALHDIDPTAVLVVGGEKAISEKVAKKVGPHMRIGGADSYATAELMAEFASDHGMVYDNIYVTTGEDWEHTLAVGALATQRDALIMLTPPDRLDNNTLDFFMGHCSGIKHITFVGRADDVSPDVMKRILAASETHLNREHVAVVRGDLLNSVTAVTSDTVSFASNALTAERVVPGRILVFNRQPGADKSDPARMGMLRRVLGVTVSGGQIVANTRDARLTEVIEKGSVDVDTDPVTAQHIADQEAVASAIAKAKKAGRPIEVRAADAAVFAYRYDTSRNIWKNEAETASIDTTATFAVTVFADIEMAISGWSLQAMAIQLNVNENLFVALGFTWQDELEAKEFALATIPVGEWGVDLGIIDLGVGVQIKPVVGWENVTGEFDTEFRLYQTFAAVMRMVYIKGVGTQFLHVSNTGFGTELDAHGRATARPYVGIKVELVICGSDANTVYLMPDAYLSAQAEGEFHARENFATTSGKFDAELEFGVEWRVGYNLDLFGLYSNSDYYAGNIYSKQWTFGAGYVH